MLQVLLKTIVARAQCDVECDAMLNVMDGGMHQVLHTSRLNICNDEILHCCTGLYLLHMQESKSLSLSSCTLVVRGRS